MRDEVLDSQWERLLYFITMEYSKMIRDELYYQNRIELMKSRRKDNASIIRKCERRIKQLNNKNK